MLFDCLNFNQKKPCILSAGLSIRCRMCLFIIGSHCLWGFVFGTCFVMQYICISVLSGFATMLMGKKEVALL